MPAAKTAKPKDQPLEILQIAEDSITFHVLGRTPIILHRMSQKGLHDLLFPPAKKNAAERAASLKHNPLEEYRASAYLDPSPSAPTRLLVPATAFKGALRGVATDMPGSTRAQIGRLTYVEGDMISIYGQPQIIMAVVRSADINRTPDVRTRLIVPEWAATVTVRYVTPLLNHKLVANLFAASGVMQGVGDWRQEKGNGNYGQFDIVDPTNEDYLRIKEIGRDEQQAAIDTDTPAPYDAETAELFSWFFEEADRRGLKLVA